MRRTVVSAILERFCRGSRLASVVLNLVSTNHYTKVEIETHDSDPRESRTNTIENYLSFHLNAATTQSLRQGRA